METFRSRSSSSNAQSTSDDSDTDSTPEELLELFDTALDNLRKEMASLKEDKLLWLSGNRVEALEPFLWVARFLKGVEQPDFNVEKAVRCLRKYHEFLVRHNWENSLAAHTMEAELRGKSTYFLPTRDYDGRGIIVFDPAQLDFSGGRKMVDYQRMGLIVAVEAAKLRHIQLHGACLIVDLRGASLGLVKKATFADMRRGVNMLSSSVPIRVTRLFLVGMNPGLKTMISVFKPLLKRKADQGQIEFIKRDLSNLSDHIPQSSLPPSLGGTFHGHWDEWVDSRMGGLTARDTNTSFYTFATGSRRSMASSMPSPNTPIALRFPRENRKSDMRIAQRIAEDPSFREELVSNRVYHFKKYRSCFVGSSAVKWMMAKGYAKSVEQAEAIGNEMIREGIFHHVVDDHLFKNDDLFYRFLSDECEEYVSSLMTVASVVEEISQKGTRVKHGWVGMRCMAFWHCKYLVVGGGTAYVYASDLAPRPNIRYDLTTRAWSVIEQGSLGWGFDLIEGLTARECFFLSSRAEIEDWIDVLIDNGVSSSTVVPDDDAGKLEKVHKVATLLLDPQRGIQHLVKDRRFRLKKYPKCFVGSDLVDWFMENKLAESRSMAVKAGNELLRREIFHHVCDDHFFKDAHLFYRFLTDEPRSVVTSRLTPSMLNLQSVESHTQGWVSFQSGLGLKRCYLALLEMELHVFRNKLDPSPRVIAVGGVEVFSNTELAVIGWSDDSPMNARKWEMKCETEEDGATWINALSAKEE